MSKHMHEVIKEEAREIKEEQILSKNKYSRRPNINFPISDFALLCHKMEP